MNMRAYRNRHRLTNADRRGAALRIALVFLAAMCFVQVVSTQHIHALDDIDQACVICGFSDTQVVLLSCGVKTDPPVLCYERPAGHSARVRVKASSGYEARAPPFSSYD